MKISNKETMGLLALGIGLLALKDRNYDINRDGVEDNTDKGLMIILGALAFFYFF